MALSRKTVDASGLAAQHGKAQIKRENAITKANAEYEATRQAVIEVGTQRVSEISVLQSELEKEKASIAAVLADVPR